MNIVALAASAAGEIPNWFAVTMGIGTVFVGLISIIIICLITGAVCGNKNEPAKKVLSTPASVGKKEDNREIIAAVCAAAAEEMGADVSALKVISFKKIQ